MKPDHVLIIASIVVLWIATALLNELVFLKPGVLLRAQIFSATPYLFMLSTAMLLHVAGISSFKRAFSKRQY